MPPKKMAKYEWKDSKFFQTEEERKAPRVIPMVYFIYDQDQTGEAGRLLRVEVHISVWDCKCYDHRWWGDKTMKDNRVLVPDTDLVMEGYELSDGTPAEMEREAFELTQELVEKPVSTVKARVYFTVAGTNKKIRGECTYPNASSTHPKFNQFIQAMKSKGIHGVKLKDGNGEGYDWEGWYDTVPGWGCLDQDWYEVETDIETSWGWCMPSAFSWDEWKEWGEELHTGNFLMMVFYLESDGTKIPHH